MDKEKLNRLLTDLHDELGSAETVDESSTELLRQAMDDIRDAVGSDDVTSGTPHPVRDQLERSAVEFESEHPRIAGILGQIADTLGKLGI